MFEIDSPPGLPPPSFELEGELYQVRHAASQPRDVDMVAIQRVLIAVSQGDARALAALRGLGVDPADAAFAFHCGLLVVSRRSRPPAQPGRRITSRRAHA